MVETQTSEEAKRNCIEKMGESLGTIYHALWQELVWLHVKWSEYVELFGTKESRVDVLNRSAPRLFRIVQDSLWHDVLLHIARLTDPPASAGKLNLTVWQIPELIDDARVRGQITALLEAAKVDVNFCRDWRNRHIAHRDLALSLARATAVPLEPASRAHVRKALSTLCEILNAVSGHYLDSETAFDLVTSLGGAVSLLYIIDDGLTAEAERSERISRHEWRENDLKPRHL